jgi:Cytochrome P450
MKREFTGFLDAPYDDVFRRRQKLCLSILKRFGFGQRHMETVISANIEHFINKSKATGGRAFDPNAYLEQSVFSIISTLVFGERFPYGHPALTEVNDLLRKYVFSFVLQLDFFPLLRFVPPFRGRKNWAVTNHQRLLKTLDRMVGLIATFE